MQYNKKVILIGLVFILTCISFSLYHFFLVPSYRAEQKEKLNRIKEEKQIQLKKDREAVMQMELHNQVNAYLENHQIDISGVSIYIESMDGQIIYDLNGDVQRIAASTYKLPLAVIWYDKINTNEISLTDTLTYLPNCYEEGGSIGMNYTIGSQISLEELLKEMIVNSDNTAAHILFEHLGNWYVFKEQAAAYSDAYLSDEFFSIENYLSAHYSSDILQHIWNHQDLYKKLIQDMKSSMPNAYLDQNISIEMAQKYGKYDIYENSIGFVPCKRTYSICVFTNLSEQGIEIMADINAIAYQILSV